MTWTTIPDAAVNPGGRPRGSTITALRDNVPALANGDAGAPRIQAAAMQSPSAGDIVIDVLSTNQPITLSNGSSSPTTINGTFSVAKGCVLLGGVIRVKGNFSGTPTTMQIQVYRAGAFVTAVSGNFSLDVGFAPGETFEFLFFASASVPGNGTVVATLNFLTVSAASRQFWRS